MGQGLVCVWSGSGGSGLGQGQGLGLGCGLTLSAVWWKSRASSSLCCLGQGNWVWWVWVTHPLSSQVEVQSQLQPLLSLVGADAELLPDPVEARQRVSGGAGGASEGLTENHGSLQQLAAIVVGALWRTAGLASVGAHFGCHVFNHDGSVGESEL